MDKKEALKQLKAKEIVLEEVDKELRSDKDVVLAAVKNFGGDLEYADDALKADKKVVIEAIKQDGCAFEYADEKLKSDKKFLLEIVKEDGYALEYADDKLKADKEIVLEAIKDNGHVISYAAEILLNDKKFIQSAIKINEDVKDYVDWSLDKVEDSSKSHDEIYKDFIKSEDLKGKKLTKISVYLRNISEKEDASGTYTFEDGTTKEGGAYFNNVLSGTIDFPNQDGDVTFKDFIERLEDNEWAQYISEFIDNFSGEGKSIDYEEDEFEDFEHLDTVDCEYDAKNNPSEIYFYFGDKKVIFTNTDNLYLHQNISYSKENIAGIVNFLI
jgi:hypothetical protein